MFACLYIPDFFVQAALLSEAQDTREILRRSPVVVLDGPANLLKVVDLNDPARKVGIGIGMTKLQVGTCGGVLLRKRSEIDENSAQALLIKCANTFSPKIESTCMGTVILDLTGTEKLFGSPEMTAQKICASAREQGLCLQIAIASNPDTALYAARGFAGMTVIPLGQEAQRLASLDVGLLPLTPEMLETLDSWGIKTFQALGRLPDIPLTVRLGQDGLSLQRLAKGQTQRALVPIGETPSFIESYEFDDPVETLESLVFILNRLLQQICSRLISHSQATNDLRLALDLAVSQRRVQSYDEQYRQEWKLPVPTQDKNLLLTLVRLDLERNTFIAPIKKIVVEVQPIKPRIAQGNLFAPPSPEAERLEITLARIRGIVGDTDAEGRCCVGSPDMLDTHKPDSFTVRSFSSTDTGSSTAVIMPTVALRVFRPALETSVELTGHMPHLVSFGRRYRHVLAASGPWCSSGNWWNDTWARQEWDVALKTTAGIGYYRIYQDRIRERWFVEGIFD